MALSNKPLAIWTADDVVAWLVHIEALNWGDRSGSCNNESPLTVVSLIDASFGIAMGNGPDNANYMDAIRLIFEQHKNWYRNEEAFCDFLRATLFISFITDLGFDGTSVSHNFFEHLQEFVTALSQQPTPSDSKEATSSGMATPAYIDDEPTTEDDREVKLIMDNKSIEKVRTMTERFNIQQQALQVTHDCTRWLAWEEKEKPKKQFIHCLPRAFRRL